MPTKTKTLELTREEVQVVLSLISRDRKTQRRVAGLLEKFYTFLANSQ